MSTLDSNGNPPTNPFRQADLNILRVARHLIREPDAWNCKYYFRSVMERINERRRPQDILAWCALGAMIEGAIVVGIMTEQNFHKYGLSAPQITEVSQILCDTVNELHPELGLELFGQARDQISHFNDSIAYHDQILALFDRAIESLGGIVGLTPAEIAWVNAVRTGTVTPVAVLAAA